MSVTFGAFNISWLFEFLLTFHDLGKRIKMVSLLLIIKIVMIVGSSNADIFVEDSVIKISNNVGFDVTKSILN